MRRTYLYIILFALLSLATPLRAVTGTPDTCYTDSSVTMRFRIYYPINKTTIHEDYMDNHRQLARIKRYLAESPHIDSITIYSYASPEGPYRFNKWLSGERGKTAKRYLLENTPAERHLPDSLIIIDPTAENWEGLREEILDHYTADDLPELLAVLDLPDISDERRKVLLRRLNGGKPWRYILKHIMPHLRYATWITVWQTIKVELPMPTQAELRIEIPPVPMPVLTPVDMPLPEPEVTDTKTILAVKSNLLYDALTLVNYSVEVPIGDRFSALYYHQFPWWRWGEHNNKYCLRFLSIGGEGRWWFKPMPRPATERRLKRDRLVGHFLGLYAESGKWDFERRRDICHQGEFWSVGLSYGYAMPIGRRLNLELSLSAGYASIPYRGYTPSEDYSILWRDPSEVGRWHYFGLTKAQVSLVLPFMVSVKKKGGLR